MSLLDKTADKAQLIDILKSMKYPIMGAGGGFAPIGTINFFDASVAPNGWLACDGSVVNIADYPDLATYYASVHGSSNFYGGNGTTTFAVPDLRGEFLRGTGTNGHANQGDGANVGVHQDGTEMPQTYASENVGITAANTPWQEADTTKTLTTKANVVTLSTAGGTYGTVSTSRPTNTSFLICVKATVAGDANAHHYSTDEQIVGMTEDGEYLYEITLKGNKPINTVNQEVSIPVSDTIVSYAIDGYMKTSKGDLVKLGYWNNAKTDSFQAFVNTSNKKICILPTNLAGTYRFVYQYTKTTDQWQTS